MKRCPDCRRDYYDDSLMYCLEDGAALVQGAVPVSDEHRTAIFPTSEPQTTILPALQARSKVISLELLALFVVLLVVLGLAAFKFWPRNAGQPSAPAPMKMTRLTTTGKASNVAISPDGRFVVHVQDDGGQQSLWMRQTATQSNVQIAPPAAVTYDSLTFSTDGNFVYYSVSGQEYPQRVLFKIPTLGGSPQKILENLDGDAISFSPDGSQFAFVRTLRGTETSLMTAHPDGTGERKVISDSNPPKVFGSPAWSPDGKTIVYAVLEYESNVTTLNSISLDDGATQGLTSQSWLRVAGLAWASDGRSLMMLAPAEHKFSYQVWQVAYPQGDARQLTNDLDDYEFFSVTRDSKTLALVKRTVQSNLWTTPIGSGSERLEQVTSGPGQADSIVAWTPDGSKIVYVSDVSGNEDIWIVNADGSDPKQLTQNSRVNRHPAVSPDGRTIVFLSDRSGGPHLWQMNIDGTGQRQLTNAPMGEQAPQFSPDGRWIVYSTAQSYLRSSWRIPADGSQQPVRITEKFASYPVISPDNRSVAYFYKDDQSSPWRIGISPIDGGPPTRSFDLPPSFERPLRWTGDGRGLAYIDTRNGVSNIVVQPLSGGPPKPLTDFKSDSILWFDISRDGKRLALAKGRVTNDVVLMSDPGTYK